MKILIVRNTPDVMEYAQGSYNLQEVGLARALNRLGHTCDVAYSGGKQGKTVEIEYAPGKTFRLFYLRVTNIFGNGYLHGLDALIQNYDVIQSGGYDQLRSWMLAKKYPEKLVIYHGPYYSAFNKRYNLKCKIADALFLSRYRKMDTKFLTKSRLAGDFLREKGLSNVTPLGVGFDPAQMGPGVDSDFQSKLAELKQAGNKLLLYVGRLEERRNLLFLLDVFRRLKQSGGQNRKLVIIGKGDREYKEKIFAFASQHGLMEDIVYKERLEQKYLPAVYSTCDVFLLPTKFEIFGMVLLEAMYYGVPAVTTYNGGSSILIESGRDGLVLEEDAEVWTEQLQKLISDEALPARLGENAHRKIAEQFTWDALAQQFLACYRGNLRDHGAEA